MFEWDENKNELNIRNHGIDFEKATGIFSDPNLIEIYDSAHSSIDEDRYICIGCCDDHLILMVVFTDRNGNIRLISARHATEKERKEYYENIS